MNFSYETRSFGNGTHRIDVLHLDKPVEYGLAGMVTSPMFSHNVALVVQNKSDRFDFACLSSFPDTAAGRIVMEEDIFYGIKRGDPFATTVLFHELGHFYHNHLENGMADMDIYDAKRLQDVHHGKVSRQELEADQFAASYLGTTVVIDSFKRLAEKIAQQYKDSPDEWAEAKLAIAELNMRIEVLHKDI